MSRERTFACQWWSASKQLWVLNIHENFSTVKKAKKYGKKYYKEFRVIERGAIRYTHIYVDGILVKSAGPFTYLEPHMGSTLEDALARQRRVTMNKNDWGSIVDFLSNISGELGGIDIVLSKVQYYLIGIGGYDSVTQDVIRQRSLLGRQIRRIDHLSYKLDLMARDHVSEIDLEIDDDVQDSRQE